MLNSLTAKITPRLPRLVVALCLLQPLLDILSFWQERLGFGNTLTLLLRFALLLAVAGLGFLLSRRKKTYLLFAAVCALVLAGHIYACHLAGYVDFVADTANFVRVIQMPLFVLCFVTLLRANPDCFPAFKTGLLLNLGLITAVFILSVLTNSYESTYETRMGFELGIMGWFSAGNAQSAILSLLTPLCVMIVHQRGKYWLIALTVAASFAQLYFLGTRLAFLAMAATTVGIPFVLIVTKQEWKKTAAILLVAMLICTATVKLSPMYINQTLYNSAMDSKQSDAFTMMSRELGVPDIRSIDWDSLDEEELNRVLQVIYAAYQAKLVDRFGLEPILDVYEYSHEIMTITGTRYRKIVFCRMLMKEHDPISRVFGLELGRMAYGEDIYDVENDFHGIYFLYGWAGLGLMLAFIGYFIFLIVKALTENGKKYFTLDAGAVGIAFCLALAYAYTTAGVLRRPNSSFYLSLVLALVYYLVKLHRYPEQPAE